MSHHTLPLKLQGTSKQTLSRQIALGRLSVASCALVLTLGQSLCFAQAAPAREDAPNPPAVTSQQGAPDVVKELDAMKRRIEQLEAELNKEKQDKEKDRDRQAQQAPSVAAVQPATKAANAVNTEPVTTSSSASTVTAAAVP